MAQRILVINDNQEILELFRLLLEDEAGYEVTLFSFAPHELEEIERVQPDLVIIDFLFGGEKLGWQLLQKMRMYRPTAAIPVIICTAALPEVRVIEGQLTSNGALLVAKPFDIDELLSAVERALTTLRHELVQRNRRVMLSEERVKAEIAGEGEPESADPPTKKRTRKPKRR